MIIYLPWINLAQLFTSLIIIELVLIYIVRSMR
jgi:hypothetical protein